MTSTTSPPMEVWMLIQKALRPSEANILMNIRLSRVCQASRAVFMSDEAWKSLNPYGCTNGIAAHFCEKTKNMSAEELTKLYMVWNAAQSANNMGTMQQLISGLGQHDLVPPKPDWSLYYGLGYAVCTAFIALRHDIDLQYMIFNKQLLLRAIEINPLCIARAGSELQLDKDIHNAASLEEGDMSFEDDELDQLDVINSFFSKMYRFLPNDIRYLLPVILNSLRRDPGALSCLPDKYRYNRQLTIYAMSYHGISFHNLPCEFQHDRDIIIKAAHQDKRLLLTLPEVYLSDRKLLLEIFGENSNDSFGKDRIEDAVDKAKILQRINISWSNSDSKLREDFEVMHRLVSWNGLAVMLLGGDSRLISNTRIVFAALKQNGLAIVLLPAICRASYKLASISVQSNGLSLSCFPNFAVNYHVVWQAVGNNGNAFEFASPALRQDKALCLRAVCQDGNALRFAGISLQLDTEVVTAAVTQNGSALKFAGSAFKFNNHIKEIICGKAVLSDNVKVMRSAVCKDIGAKDGRVASRRGRQQRIILA